MKRAVLVAVFLLLYLVPVAVRAQSPTPTDTPTDTPTATTTATPTASLTSTPNLISVSTLESGQQWAIVYTVTVGEGGIMAVQLAIFGLLIFIALILVRRLR